MPTPEIFDFDSESLSGYDAQRAAEALESRPEIYVNHLRVAKAIDAWGAQVEGGNSDTGGDFNRGYLAGLRDVAARLRQADFVVAGAERDDTHERFKGRT